jgi:hypothetical protein
MRTRPPPNTITKIGSPSLVFTHSHLFHDIALDADAMQLHACLAVLGVGAHESRQLWRVEHFAHGIGKS